MKAFKIKRKQIKQPVFIKEVISGTLPTPKLPRKVFFKPVDYKGAVEMVWEDGVPKLRYHQY
jgi:hypothetical protein